MYGRVQEAENFASVMFWMMRDCGQTLEGQKISTDLNENTNDSQTFKAENTPADSNVSTRGEWREIDSVGQSISDEQERNVGGGK